MGRRQKRHERWLAKVTVQFEEIIERRKKSRRRRHRRRRRTTPAPGLRYDAAALMTACIDTCKLRDVLEANVDAEHTREQVDRLIALADVDGDGSVDYDEFKAMLATNARIRDIFPCQF